VCLRRTWLENEMARFVTGPEECLKKTYLKKDAALRIRSRNGRRFANREDW